VLQQQLGPLGLARVGVDVRGDVLLEDVVPQDHDHAFVPYVGLGLKQRVRDASLSLLLGERDADPELGSVTEQGLELIDLRSRHDHQIGHSRSLKRLDRIEDHRLVEDIEQMFVDDSGHRVEAGAEASREHDSLHDISFT
jgi:hypothetical protein